jgi:hypothetical protein
MWRCREARLSSSLSSAHVAKQRHPRFFIPGDRALTIGCVKGWRSHHVVTSQTPFTSADRKVRDCGMRWRLIRRPGAAGLVVVGFSVSLQELVVGGADALEGLDQKAMTAYI